MNKQSDSSLLFRIFSYTKGVRLQLLIAIMLSLVAVVVELCMPLLNGLVIEELFKETIVFQKILYLVVMGFILLIISTLIYYFSIMVVQKSGQKIIFKIRNDVFSHIESLSIAQINKEPVGRLVTRVTSDTNALNDLVTNVFINLIKASALFLGTVCFMFFINVKMASIMMILAPILIVLTVTFRYFSRKAYRVVRKDISNMNAFLSENLSGMKLTQMFNQEEKILNNFQQRNKNINNSQIKEILIFGVFRPSIYVLLVTANILIITTGVTDIISGVLSVSLFVTFYGLLDKFFSPIQTLAVQFNLLQSSLSASERLFEMIDTPIDILDDIDAIELDDFKGEIEFKNVCFSYIEGVPILKDVSFHIKPKEQVAFVGATGAGKTTILALVIRNYEINSGQILIDGIDISKIKIASLRRHVGQMLQDVFLFSGSIKDNITMRDESFTEEQINQAIQEVNLTNTINELPNKLEFQVKERGNNFSAGERQLISFARTIITRPKIMILDEATSNIDTHTEVLIQKSLEKMKTLGTMLIVAHRLSTVVHSDKIIVLHKGEVKEMGSHEELLLNKGLYFNLYELQYKNKGN
ncbi:MAG: ABC transporter ATP-binding protein [bacterium]